jgi:hypothetical protein
MTRQPDINSQTKTLVFKAKTLEEEKVTDDVKKLAIQDGLQVHDLLLEAIGLVFKIHHWPPGNPQLTLPKFAEGKPVIQLGKCGFANCSYKAVEAKAVYLPNEKEYNLCEKHLKLAKNDAKNWRFQKKESTGGLF